MLAMMLAIVPMALGQATSVRCATCRAEQPRSSAEAYVPRRAAQGQDKPVQIDHLILFDASGERYASEHYGSATALAELAVRTMNEAMRNSDVAATFRLAGVEVLPREFRSIDEGQDFILNDDAVHRIRRELRADVVTLCVQNIGDGTTGVATQAARRAMAYSTVMASEVAGYVVAHEVAHIFGCEHSRSVDRADQGQHTYAVGVERAPYYTIMGFPSPSLGAHELAPVFSGVKSVWRGVQLGSPTQDNVRMLRERMHEVATFGDYLEARYYVDKAVHYVANASSVVQVDVKTSEFFQPQSDAPWLRCSLSNGQTYAIDDVLLRIQVDANTSGRPRSGRVTLSGTDSYEPVVITIHQGIEDPATTSVDAVEEGVPFLVAASSLGWRLLGSSVDALEIYALTGERLLQQGATPLGATFAQGLPRGSYVCRMVRSGRIFTLRI